MCGFNAVQADAIAVVQQGKILEMGTHDNLMAARKAYFSLVRHQADH
jgi:ABC-type multidrug transport system fused ATPase/permease subunit